MTSEFNFEYIVNSVLTWSLNINIFFIELKGKYFKPLYNNTVSSLSNTVLE